MIRCAMVLSRANVRWDCEPIDGPRWLDGWVVRLLVKRASSYVIVQVVDLLGLRLQPVGSSPFPAKASTPRVCLFQPT